MRRAVLLLVAALLLLAARPGVAQGAAAPDAGAAAAPDDGPGSEQYNADYLLANFYNATCDNGYTELLDADTSELISNLTTDAFEGWLYYASYTTPGVSCNYNITQDWRLWLSTACQQGADYNIYFAAAYTCFYNETEYDLFLDNEDAVLSDLVLLQTYMFLGSADATTDASATVYNITLMAPALQTHDASLWDEEDNLIY